MILFYDACAVIYQVELKAPWYQRLQGFATRARSQNPKKRKTRMQRMNANSAMTATPTK